MTLLSRRFLRFAMVVEQLPGAYYSVLASHASSGYEVYDWVIKVSPPCFLSVKKAMNSEQQFHQRNNAFPRRLVGLIVFVALVVALLILSSYRLGSRMIERYTPLVDAVMELQLHVTTSHLWFEEILSDDKNERISLVYNHLDMAERYVELMLYGGMLEGVYYTPLQDEQMIAAIDAVQDKLSEFRSIVDKRWEMRADSGPGSALDQKFDTVFNQLITQADEMERRLQGVIQQAMHRFFLTHTALLVFAVAITFTIGWTIRRFLLRQAYGVYLLERANLELASEVEKRKHTEAMLEKQATTDHLTGILNRSKMSELLDREWERAGRYQENFSIIMFDIDHFKDINDSFGHHAGDSALIEITHRVKRELRDIDAFARWGGEEFLILLPGTGMAGAKEVAYRCRENVSEEPVEDVGIITASFGVVSYSEEDGTLQGLLQRADAALYEAKEEGRDRVSCEYN